MKRMSKSIFTLMLIFAVLSLMVSSPSTAAAAKAKKATKETKEAKVDPSDKLAKANAAFDANKMGDMSGFDPGTWVSPTGDTIKIAIVASYSGPSTVNGQFLLGYSCLGCSRYQQTRRYFCRWQKRS